MMNGSVAGMAAICAGCDSLPSWAAVLSGILGGIAFIVGRAILEKLEGNLRFNERFLKLTPVFLCWIHQTNRWQFQTVDDPVDGFAIHFCGGLAGLLSAPFLIREGILFKGDAISAVVSFLSNLNILDFILICQMPFYRDSVVTCWAPWWLFAGRSFGVCPCLLFSDGLAFYAFHLKWNWLEWTLPNTMNCLIQCLLGKRINTVSITKSWATTGCRLIPKCTRPSPPI